MAQRPHISGRVVSVRMPEEIITRLDALSERTSRSRGFYLKMAVTAMLTHLEKYHWEQVAADFEGKSIENEFYRIMLAGLSAETDDKEY
ncbi:ribbon-helix-helix domain-containing protein [Corynebacterium sp. ES2715-CONJ3]|uniref:ribbon-helix-helix domain-containing protein n=1 Tax=Corynebacterium sp. ES2715-CONJ3 TaxID=2974028 RepID=UPI00216A52BE|nr:ribbon-helix-helix domain-containing protein [Corynebacterium sp. ES2715-CONJ3]MCS4492592.1 ribbon-helix-helix domain-containing protein [Corynebacterium sp. ES2715-CONJ3]